MIMIMKKITKILVGAFLLSLFAACSKEDTPVPNIKDTSYYFEPLPSDTSEEAELRRAFSQKHGSHLLFTDTIQHEFLGMNFLGDSLYFTEKLDINYYIGSSYGTGTLHYTYENLTTIEQKRKAVEFVETYVLPHFTADLTPYSWLLVSRIAYHNALHQITYPYACSGQRATAVACNGVMRYNESQLKKLSIQVISSLSSQIVTNNSNLFEDFKAVSRRYYGNKFAEITISSKENTEYLRNAGLLSKGKNEWGNIVNGWYPTDDIDLTDYTTLVITYTMEQIQEMYGQYPLIIQKAELFRDAMHSLGFKFDDDL